MTNPELPVYRTVSLIDDHYLSERGLPISHRTERSIVALQPLDRIPYKFSTDAMALTDINVEYGGSASDIYEVAPGIQAFDIIFDSPLDPGEETTVEYVTRCDYKEPPPPRFRRNIGEATLKYLQISVNFDSLRIPSEVFWAQWDGYQSDSLVIPRTKEKVTPTPISKHEESPVQVFRSVSDINPGVFGFYWEWGEEPPQ